MIEVEGLTVRFAGVTPIDGMSVTFPGGTCGLIGPNGAGKTTFFNVLSGFVKPAAGSIRAFGEDLLKMADYRRARWGLRRTFQTEQAIEQLSVFDNVAMIYEHSGVKGAGKRAEVEAAIDFVGLEAPSRAKVGGLGARERRLVEVADHDRSGGGAEDAPDREHERRLPCPVRPEQRRHLARRDRDRHRAQDGAAAALDGEPVERERRSSRAHATSSVPR